MSWERAPRKDPSCVIPLILRDEALCVPLSARLRDQSRGFSLYVNAGERGTITECFLLSPYGLLLPVFDDAGDDEAGLDRILRVLQPPVHSIMGAAPWVERIEPLLPLPPSTRVEYFLMNLKKEEHRHSAAAASEIQIKKGSVLDAQILFPLQKSYEKEEVVINPALFNDSQCMKFLKNSLREELLFFAEKEGRPVAKAGTNARGYTVDQIGGVYTVPEERGKGLATAVMDVLLEDIFRDKKAASLFVKKKNAAAISLYNRLGFKTVCDYVISYYGV